MEKILRPLSFLISASAALSILIFPRAVAADASSVPFPFLVLLMLGVSASFVYGVGFVPENRILRLVFSPAAAWPLMFFAACRIFFF